MDSWDDADSAIERLDGHEHDGQRLHVSAFLFFFLVRSSPSSPRENERQCVYFVRRNHEVNILDLPLDIILTGYHKGSGSFEDQAASQPQCGKHAGWIVGGAAS